MCNECVLGKNKCNSSQNASITLKCDGDINQGIVDSTGTGTFAKKP